MNKKGEKWEVVGENRVLLWDDDIGWGERLRRELERQEIIIEEVENGDDLYVRQVGVAAVVVSEGQLREALREEWQVYFSEFCEAGVAPVIFIAEGGDENQELQVFRMGASDYITRMKSTGICVARIIACIGRKGRNYGVCHREPILAFDQEGKAFYLGRDQLDLTAKEYLVLACLYSGGGKVVDRQVLLQAAWGESQPECRRVLDTVIKQLRHKLAATGYIIRSKYGEGYYLERNMSKKRAETGFYVG